MRSGRCSELDDAVAVGLGDSKHFSETPFIVWANASEALASDRSSFSSEHCTETGDSGVAQPLFETPAKSLARTSARSTLPVISENEVRKLLIEALSMGALKPEWTRSRYLKRRDYVAAALTHVTDRVTGALRLAQSGAWPAHVVDALRSRLHFTI